MERRGSTGRRRSKISFLSMLPRKGSSVMEDEQQDVYKQSRAVKCIRIAMVFVLLLAAGFVSFLLFYIMKEYEIKAYELKFEDSVVKVFENFQLTIDQKVWISDTLSALYTSTFLANEWPNVTLNNFLLQTTGELYLSCSVMINFAPLISNVTRLSWEAYASEMYNNGSNENGNAIFWNVSDGIFSLNSNDELIYDPGYEEGSIFPNVLLPIWQTNPNALGMTMFDQHSESIRQNAIDDMLLYKEPALTNFIDEGNFFIEEKNPGTILFYPIFKDYSYEEIVGSVSMKFLWDDVFSNILPNYVKGIVCVLSTPTGGSYTYEINGEEATFIDKGDRHDSRYDDSVKTKTLSLNALLNITSSMNTTIYEPVIYTLKIYPSDNFKAVNRTRKPQYLMMGVLLIFLFTSGFFFLYDFLVQYHHKAISRIHSNSNRIVKSLFPLVVRDRLFQMNSKASPSSSCEKKKSNHLGNLPVVSNIVAKPVNILAEFLALDLSHTNEAPSQNKRRNSMLMSITSVVEPIADLFQSTTIMFADIAGFTSWSSSHKPQEVFYFLETLFKEFDITAKRLGVFKVETIGDCYVAVAGLPQPREDHALVMSQFALECQNIFTSVTKRLNEKYNTSNILLRSGLHSGPITAGILRGDKSRFQLFGDSWDLANRMESAGESSKVHVSYVTADLLKASKKQHWIIPRNDLVHLKGKTLHGQHSIKTFWLVPNAHINDLKRPRRRISLKNFI